MQSINFYRSPDPDDSGDNNSSTDTSSQSSADDSSTANSSDNSSNSSDGTTNTSSNTTDQSSDTTDQSVDDSSTANSSNAPTNISTDNSLAGSGNASADSDTNNVAAPDPEYIDKVLTGAVGISKVSEAVAIVTAAEFAIEVIEPIGAVLEIAHMILAVWKALETPDRTCAYQGLVYGLMYTALNMGDPKPNPTWPDLRDAPLHDQKFFEGVTDAKARLSEGQQGVKRKNLLLLDVAKRGEKAVINNLWQQAITDDDHLLKMFTIEWPNVGPNG